MCLVRCRLIVTQGTPSLALCVANLVVTGNCSEQFTLNLQKHADTTSVSRTTDFESLLCGQFFVSREVNNVSVCPFWSRYKSTKM
jgi:hypothetical protein